MTEIKKLVEGICAECGISTKGRKIRSLWNNTLCEDCGEYSDEEDTETPEHSDEEDTETPAQRAFRFFKEDEEAYEMKFLQELQERRLKRIAVVEKNKDALDAMIVGKQKAIRWRKYFHGYVFEIAKMNFKTEDQEYKYIGKAGRMHWTDHEEMDKAFKKTDPMHGVIGDIMREFGCFEY